MPWQRHRLIIELHGGFWSNVCVWTRAKAEHSSNKSNHGQIWVHMGWARFMMAFGTARVEHGIGLLKMALFSIMHAMGMVSLLD